MSGGLLGGLNTYAYAYVEGNPLTFVDPSGLKSLGSSGMSIGRELLGITRRTEPDTVEQMPRRYENSEQGRDGYMRFGGPELPIIPQRGGPSCRQVCPDAGGRCESMPKLGLPSGGGCYTVCDDVGIGPRSCIDQDQPLSKPGDGAQTCCRQLNCCRCSLECFYSKRVLLWGLMRSLGRCLRLSASHGD